MAPANIDLEQVVQEVVRRLSADPGRPAETSPSESPNQLRLNDPVISLATIEAQLEGIKQLVVAPTAVITPSVQDELRQRQITVTRRPNEPRSPSAWQTGRRTSVRPRSRTSDSSRGLLTSSTPI